MLYSLSGKLISKNKNSAVIETTGIGFKIVISLKTAKKLPKIGAKAKLFCYLNIKQDGAEIYGFLDEKELEIFKLLTSVSGVGPKSAIGILSKLNSDRFLKAVKDKRADLIAESSSIGKKKAERIILELKDRIKAARISEDFDYDEEKEIRSALKNLGYKNKDIEEVLENILSKRIKKEEKLKLAIRALSKK